MVQSYRECHMTKGVEYDEEFRTIPYRAMMWRLEQWALDSVFMELGAGLIRSYLDFACGTGRLLAFAGRYAHSLTGVDISASMLDVARSRVPGAELICGDLTRQPLLGSRRFDVISAFRFFGNAEDDLRREAIDRLIEHLEPTGVLVFNNHRNPGTLIRRAIKALGREGPEHPNSRLMRHEEVSAMVAGAGLRIARVIPLGTLPMDEGHFYGPPAVVEGIERLLSRVPATRPLAHYAIYVCRHA
jgi:SAM-dependent methyltransferase